MTTHESRLSPQIVVAAGTLAVALPVLVVGWLDLVLRKTQLQDPLTILLSLCLLAGLILSYRFPIHIRLSSKIYIGSAVLYLMAALLPPVLAATVAAFGTAVGEMAVQSRTGNPVSAILGQTGRMSMLVLAAAVVAHIAPGGSVLASVPLIAAGVVLWAGDLLTFPLLLCPLTGETPRRVIGLMLRETGLPEAAQYLVGLLGALESSRGIWTLALLVLPVGFVYFAFKNTKEMHDETRRILESMADAVDLRDPGTGGHSRRVTELTEAILRELGKSGPEAKLIVEAARVHDIGKIGIPDHILMKPGQLTPEEQSLMETHPERGADLLARYPDFVRGVDIIRHHHEAWDGTGYPHRLKGHEIPFGARVIAVADSFDAMTMDRPYRRGMSPEGAAAILRDGRGRQWDPQIVDACLRAIAARLERPASPQLRVVPGKSGTGTASA